MIHKNINIHSVHPGYKSTFSLTICSIMLRYAKIYITYT